MAANDPVRRSKKARLAALARWAHEHPCLALLWLCMPPAAIKWRQPGWTQRGNRHFAGTGVPNGLGSAVPSSACRKAP